MTGVYCFSATGRTLAAAQYFAQRLNTQVIDITCGCTADNIKTAVVAFPVYCQNIPDVVKNFLKNLHCENAVLIAAYGRMSCGNVIAEAAELFDGRVIAAACVPVGHTYLNEPADFDPKPLEPIFERISNPKSAEIYPMKKQLFADIAPALRSRIGLRLQRDIDACTECGICTAGCPMSAMKNGTPNSRCIRCLCCVSLCPEHALHFKLTLPLKHYLHKRRMTETVIFL